MKKLPKIIFKSESKRVIKIAFIGILSTLAALVVIFFSYSLAYSQSIYPNVIISGINIGGLKPDEAKVKLGNKINEVKENKIIISNQDSKKEISSQDLKITYQPDISVKQAFKIGREGGFWQQTKQRIARIFFKTNLLTAFQIDRNAYNNILGEITNKTDIAAQDATCSFEKDQVVIVSEHAGKKLDVNQFENDFNLTIGGLKNERLINAVILNLMPTVTQAQAQIAQKKTQKIIALNMVLSAGSSNITLEKNEIKNWIEFVAKKINPQDTQNTLEIFINEGKIKKYTENLAAKIDQEPMDAKLTIANGRATVWQKSQDGFSLNQDDTVKLITNTILDNASIAGVSTEEVANGETIINLPIEQTKPAISEDQINNLGIKELIGSGNTNFKGSPANRIYNIKLGAQLFNGAIIKPGEGFSTTKQLGAVSEAKGFKKELVIKEDRTEPEVGGGLCQVSTTLFRAALNSGLEITERSNHKYRVSYYEPPVGLDATIYDPSPDLKFVNNTAGYILIQTSVSGTKLTFDFYGTKDDREVFISEPELYDYVNPPEPQYIDDSSLAPGEEKYKEKAHQGVKAKVTYIVKKDGQEINKQTFYSKYVAWGAIILRGPGEAPAETPQAQPPDTQPLQPTPSEASQSSSSSPAPSASST